jgi:hypothetical protein
MRIELTEAGKSFFPQVRYTFNPSLVCLMWYKILEKPYGDKYFEAFKQLDKQMFEIYEKEMIVLYFDHYFANMSVMSMIAANDWVDLLDLEGVYQAVMYVWNGAYKITNFACE